MPPNSSSRALALQSLCFGRSKTYHFSKLQGEVPWVCSSTGDMSIKVRDTTRSTQASMLCPCKVCAVLELKDLCQTQG